MMTNDHALDELFRKARSQNGWQSEPVTDEQLHAVFDLVKMGPTSANCSPARFLFLRSHEAKERLRPALDRGNVDKTMTAPVVAIIGYDLAFFEYLPRLFPHNPDAINWFKGKPFAEPTAFRNGTLQGGYFIIAARALGIDCGPMSGFDAAKVDAEFWAGTTVRTNFLCAIGRGDPAKVFARSPRFSFDEVCRVL